MPILVGPLRSRAFRRLFGAQVVALLGTGLLTVALGLLATQVAPGRAGTVLGTALTVKMVAYVGVAPLMSAVVARLPTRRVLVGADVVRIGVAACLPFVQEAWQVYALVLLLQSASATFTPAFQALVPAVLPEERDYTRALSWSRLAYDLESVVSPLVAAGLLLVMSFHGLFVGTALGFAGSAALVLSAGVGRRSAESDPGGFWARTTRGLRIFARTPALRAVVALDLVVAATTSLVLVDTVVVVQQEWGRSQSDVALALAAFGLGSMVVALALPRVLDRTGVRAVMLVGGVVSTLALGVAIPVLAADDAWVALLLTWTLLGAGASLVLTPAGRVLVGAAAESERPAAFAAHFSLSHAWFLVAYPIAGWGGDGVGLPAVTAVLVVVSALATAAALVTWSRRPTPVAARVR